MLTDKVTNGWYKCSDSSTCTDTKDTFFYTESDWTGSCDIYTDTVCIADDDSTKCATDLYFCGFTAVSVPDFATEYRGVLGLAIDLTNTTNQEFSFVTQWAAQTGSEATIYANLGFSDAESTI